MSHYAGNDVSLEHVVGAQGEIVKEAKIASDQEALVAFFVALGLRIRGSDLRHAGLRRAGFEVALLETRHVEVSAIIVKTDRKDARVRFTPSRDPVSSFIGAQLDQPLIAGPLRHLDWEGGCCHRGTSTDQRRAQGGLNFKLHR